MDAKLSATMLSRSVRQLALLILLVGAGGASCPRMVEQYRLPVARAIPAEATLDQVAALLNENTAKIQSLTASSARISSSEFPTLRANLAVERPRRLRLVAEATAVTGAEFDFGSNDELFWFWVKRNQPPAVYFCRHDQFDPIAARDVLPIEPDWLFEALGIVTLNPQEEHQGPFPVGRGRIEIRTLVRRPQGNLTKVRVIDSAQGLLVAQHLYDSTGQRLASALASGHKRDPLSQAIVPRHVEIQWPLANFTLKLDLGDVLVNANPSGDAIELWAKPNYPGWPDVDLAGARFGVGPAGTPIMTPAAGPNSPPSSDPRGNAARINEARAPAVRPIDPPAAAPSGPSAGEPDPAQSGSADGYGSPLEEPRRRVAAQQTGFRGNPATAPLEGLSPSEASAPAVSERREIRDYAAEPVMWR